MTPTLLGRIETRLVVLATVGVAWTAVITPFLPHPLASDMAMNGMYGTIMLKNMVSISTGQPSTTPMDYHMAFDALAMMAGFGILWECLYHLLQQLRRDRDWPPLFSLLQIIPEATLIWFGLHAIHVTANTLWPSSSDMPMFAIQMLTTWVLVWAFSLGPLRVVSMRWHLQGMEFWRPVLRGHEPGLAAAPASLPTGVQAATAEGQLVGVGAGGARPGGSGVRVGPDKRAGRADV